ncbi:hypothetical protein CJ030_MR2G022349 [Morella rubra]|uniref:Uncharacterized protein n=1 Tax=Morella rubra TaxID=262757 RepID=A0A6A1WHB2_9ROSI|nr:hypothetical protein CJ030_MR2G022349 [Morella rubra]
MGCGSRLLLSVFLGFMGSLALTGSGLDGLDNACMKVDRGKAKSYAFWALAWHRSSLRISKARRNGGKEAWTIGLDLGSMALSSSRVSEAGVNPAPKGPLPVSQWVSDHDQIDLAELWLKYGISPSIVMRAPMYKERVVSESR